MKIKVTNGEKVIVLDKGETINIESSNLGTYNKLRITDTAKGFDITGNSSSINSIYGKDLIEKIQMPQVTPKEEIIEKCDKWIEMFKKTHDYFKKVTLSKAALEDQIDMEVKFSEFIGKDGKGKSIDIDLYRISTIIKEGMTINVPEENISVYLYLLANVLDYYVSKNCSNTKIDFNKLDFLHSKNSDRIYANLSTLFDYGNFRYYDVITGVITNHNLGESTKQIIDNTRNGIYDQEIGDTLNTSFDYSVRQYNILFPEEQGPVLKKTIN